MLEFSHEAYLDQNKFDALVHTHVPTHSLTHAVLHAKYVRPRCVKKEEDGVCITKKRKERKVMKYARYAIIFDVLDV